MSTHRAPIHGPGTYNGAVLPAPHFLARNKSQGVVIHEHGVAGAIIRTQRVPAYRGGDGWTYTVTRGDWSKTGYVSRQSEALAIAVGQLCRAVDKGEVSE